mmetsp:Transcript_23350/g.51246  ORF Transcript_23350/g.51246 Transcript_23350/m.51246 type:complete len:203 (+) Transcript_23350:353-961(+)
MNLVSYCHSPCNHHDQTKHFQTDQGNNQKPKNMIMGTSNAACPEQTNVYSKLLIRFAAPQLHLHLAPAVDNPSPHSDLRSTTTYCLPTVTSTSDNWNMRSNASMLANVWPTASGSDPSHLNAVMGPCNSLLTIALLSSSTAFSCFLDKPSPSLLTTFSNSDARMLSALLLKALIVGTVSRESRHASNARCSSRSRTSASAAA